MHDQISILVVEDDEIDTEALTRFFRKQNINNKIFYASNGIEALDILRGESNKEKISPPYVILLDINMPLMNGVELLAELRSDEKLKTSIVFMLTTSPREEDKRITYSLNAAGYFLKRDTGSLINLLQLYCGINQFPVE